MKHQQGQSLLGLTHLSTEQNLRGITSTISELRIKNLRAKQSQDDSSVWLPGGTYFGSADLLFAELLQWCDQNIICILYLNIENINH